MLMNIKNSGDSCDIQHTLVTSFIFIRQIIQYNHCVVSVRDKKTWFIFVQLDFSFIYISEDFINIISPEIML